MRREKKLSDVRRWEGVRMWENVKGWDYVTCARCEKMSDGCKDLLDLADVQVFFPFPFPFALPFPFPFPFPFLLSLVLFCLSLVLSLSIPISLSLSLSPTFRQAATIRRLAIWGCSSNWYYARHPSPMTINCVCTTTKEPWTKQAFPTTLLQTGKPDAHSAPNKLCSSANGAHARISVQQTQLPHHSGHSACTIPKAANASAKKQFYLHSARSTRAISAEAPLKRE